MSKSSVDLGGNAGAMVAGGAMVVVLALGAYIAFGRGAPEVDTASTDITQRTSPDVQTSAPPAPKSAAPETTEVATPETEQSEATAATQMLEISVEAPRFDEVRRETDGTTIIAGRAAPLSDVKILVDGAEVATAKTDSSGGFAAIAMLPPKTSAQVVSLSSSDTEHPEETASLDEIILAPSENAAVVSVPEENSQTPKPETLIATPEPVEEEPARVAVLKSDEEGVSLLNPEAPNAMTSVALDTIGYSDLGDVQLSGRAQADTASVRIYLDNRSVISLPVDAQGRWRGDLPDIDEGVYTLRVDELTAQGDVSSRVETPFKRESATVLAQAAATGDGLVKSVTVQTGATLWAIARERYGDGTLYVRVFEANAASIRDPDLIYPGQVFDLPN